MSMAYLAARSGKTVTVLEAGEKFGGLLDTFEIGGTRLEKFYHHFFLDDRELHWLLHELGLSNNVMYRETSMGIYRDGKIHDFNTPTDLLRFSPLNLLDKVRFGATSFLLGKFYNWRKHEERSAYEWFKKWCGERVTATIWEPLLRVKFGVHYKDVPLAWMIGRLGQRLNSRKNGKEMLGYLDGSLQVLNDRLTERLRTMGVQLVASSPVTEILVENGKVSGAKTAASEFRANQVIATVPNQVIAQLIKPLNETFAAKLNEVKYFGAFCTILELDRPLSHVYWLNMADADFPFGGVIEHTNFIGANKYGNTHIVYLSRYFTAEEEMAKLSEEELKQTMLQGVRKAFPEFSEKHLKNVHVFRTNTAATVCDLNFSTKVKACRSEIEGFTIANMMHIYPDERSVNNAIRVAANVCQSLGMDCEEVPLGNSLSGQIGIK
ncbi:MAG: NAD(P)-binding protein [Flavobacteriales bacterium]|nr:NAD(P)-binding protein [Flavobacteriales bacterium]